MKKVLLAIVMFFALTAQGFPDDKPPLSLEQWQRQAALQKGYSLALEQVRAGLQQMIDAANLQAAQIQMEIDKLTPKPEKKGAPKK